MGRHAKVLSFVLLFAGVIAGAPAHAQVYGVDSSVVPLAPGITVHVLRQGSYNSGYCLTTPTPPECDIGGLQYWQGEGVLRLAPVGVDAAGSAYSVPDAGGGFAFSDGDGKYLRRTRRDGVSENVLGFYRQRCLDPPTCSVGAYYGRALPFFLDVTNGRILILTSADIRSKPSDQPIDNMYGVLEISGLPQVFDTLLTFIPGGQISALMPAHPDGFRSADSLQVWTGPLGTMPDWSQAQPLSCEAATDPTPGQVVTVADMLPDPTPGTGRYYITVAQHAGDRRLGRQYVNGAFSARDPARLLACSE